MKCPLCLSNSHFAFEAKSIPLRDCGSCGHRFADLVAGEDLVSSVYDDSYFFGGEAGYADYTAEADMLVARGRMYAEKVARFAAPGRMLDVGAAGGFLLKGFTESGWNGIGLEPNESMVKVAKEQTGVEVVRGTLESFSLDRKFDLISMIQVAGHFYDPRKAFKRAYRVLNIGGLLLIESWNRASISARLLGRHWHEYSPPSVLQWYSLKGLTGFLGGLGFERVASGRPSKKIKGSHAKSLLKYRIGENFLVNLIPDGLNIPYPSEDLFWAVYRKTVEDLDQQADPVRSPYNEDGNSIERPQERPEAPLYT